MRSSPGGGVELHDEVTQWMDVLNDDDWEGTVIVVDRLADLGAAARMPLSRSLGARHAAAACARANP